MTSTTKSSTDAVWQAQADFALDVLRTCAPADGAANTFVSPVSIAVALAMTYTGADANTKAEMNKVLVKGASDADMHAAFGELVALLNTPNAAYKLHTANRVYVHDGTQLKSGAVDLLKTHYATELTRVNFAQHYEQARTDINAWVSTQTADRIVDLLAAGTLNALTRMVLVNAIYFKGDWRRQFKAENTRKQTFYVRDGQEKQVDMMHQTKSFEYGETADAQVLALPYKDDALAMYIVLPKQRNGLDAVVGALTGGKLLKMMRDIREREVDVSLPKLRMEASFDLCATLQTMGIKDAFDERAADFSRFTDPAVEPLFISKVVHKAFLEVDENGSEAAAATAVVMMMRCAMPMSKEKPVVFNVDHPFVLVMASKATHVLFIGRVDAPV